MDVASLLFLKAGYHVNLIRLHHFIPRVRFVWHAYHVALERVDQLTEIARVYGQIEFKGGAEGRMHLS